MVFLNFDFGHLRKGDPRSYQVDTAFDVFGHAESYGKSIDGASRVSEDGEVNISSEVKAYRTNVIQFSSAHQLSVLQRLWRAEVCLNHRNIAHYP